MGEQRCEAQRKDGEPCRAPALPGSRFCFAHDPSRVEEARAARAKGSRNAARVRTLKGHRLRLDTPHAVVKYLSGVIQDLAAGTLDPKVGGVLVYALSAQLKAIEMAGAADGAQLVAQVRQLLRQQGRAG